MDSVKTASFTKLGMSFIALIAGLILLFIGILLPPQGSIDTSVLVAFGETATFAGALAGINYSYSTKLKELENKINATQDVVKNCDK